MKEQLINWLINQKGTLDRAIFDAASKYYAENKAYINFDYDLRECQKESFNLISGEDLCYDRPNTAFTYSIWYHARRINTFLSHFVDIILNTGQDKIEIFDLGAGTGAIQWAIGLVVAGMNELGIKPPKVRIINIDSSPFMLSYGESYLWPCFLRFYPFCNKTNLETSYCVNAWNNPDDITLNNPWIVSSYLFDMSDNQKEISNNFLEIVNTFKPNNLLLLTSQQGKKIDILKSINSILQQSGFQSKGVYALQKGNLLFNGELTKVNLLRKSLFDLYYGKGLDRKATWEDGVFVGLALTKTQPSLSIGSSLKLFVISEKNRIKIRLSPEQLEISKHTEKPTVITGPAGCGKSVVITERIKNLVEKYNYNPNLRILVTTFNKDLIQYLGNWIESLLRNDINRTGSSSEKVSYFWFPGAKKRNIDVLHFDVLPTRLQLPTPLPIHNRIIENGFNGEYEDYHEALIQQIAQELMNNLGLKQKQYRGILETNFLLDEYHRVIYGFHITSLQQYMEVERKGRGAYPRLERNGTKRKFIWSVFVKYSKYLKIKNIDSFTIRRFRLRQYLEKNQLPDSLKFDYIFVDELQDCTDSDYRIFYKLLKNPNNIVLTGDLAQSIHIGSSSQTPRSEGMRKFDKPKLEGSFRLPFRISECITEVSSKINSKRKKNDNNEEGEIINPFKGSPPGARPIVFYAKTHADVKKKVKAIFDTYKIYGFNNIAIFERDSQLKAILNQADIEASDETILKAKGMEKPCVLWSTRMPIQSDNESDEFVYTILTRTSSVLIISITDNTISAFVEILKVLNPKRLIFFDRESENKFYELINKPHIERDDFSDEEVDDEEFENLDDETSIIL